MKIEDAGEPSAHGRNRRRRGTDGTGIIVSQRLKRESTIVDKLKRHPRMRLSKMHDIAGCRLVFKNIDDLYSFRENLHNAHRIKHELKNDIDKYDYIKFPKQSGYRGVHDIYSYNVNSESGRKYKGLLVEVQYRTFIQHVWADTVEGVESDQGNEPKFERGDDRYLELFRFASEVLARTFEDRKSCLEFCSDKEVIERFNQLNSELGFF